MGMIRDNQRNYPGSPTTTNPRPSVEYVHNERGVHFNREDNDEICRQRSVDNVKRR